MRFLDYCPAEMFKSCLNSLDEISILFARQFPPYFALSCNVFVETIGIKVGLFFDYYSLETLTPSLNSPARRRESYVWEFYRPEEWDQLGETRNPREKFRSSNADSNNVIWMCFLISKGETMFCWCRITLPSWSTVSLVNLTFQLLFTFILRRGTKSSD